MLFPLVKIISSSWVLIYHTQYIIIIITLQLFKYHICNLFDLPGTATGQVYHFPLKSLSSLPHLLLDLKKSNPSPTSFPPPLSCKKVFSHKRKYILVHKQTNKSIRPLVNNVALSINWIPQFCKRLSVSPSPLSLFHEQVFCKLHQESFQYSSQRGRHRCNYTTTEFSSVICSYAPKYLHHKCSCPCTSRSTTISERCRS